MMNKIKITPAKYTAKQVADYFIYLSTQQHIDDNTTEGITPLKLQKLLYFGQAVSLSIYNTKLFKDDIEAWKYGPVIPSLYNQYKHKQNKPIITPTGDYKDIQGNKIKKEIQGTWELFGKFSAGELVDITHNHKPWKDIYREDKNHKIPPKVIKEYYTKIFELQEDSDE